MENERSLRLCEGIAEYLEKYSPSDALKILREEFGFTDEELKTMGFGFFAYLFDFDEDEEDEKPLKSFTFEWRETMKCTQTVKAHDLCEAWDLIEQSFMPMLDEMVHDNDGEWNLISEDDE